MALTRITKGVIKPNENYDTHNINSTGIVTAIGLDVNGNGDISGNLNVGGVLTYEDVTSIDAVGLITARNGIDCNGDIDVDGHTNLDNVSVAGITTYSKSGSALRLNDGSILRLGNADADFFLYHDGNNIDYISAGASKQLRLTTDDFVIKGANNTETLMTAAKDGAVTLYHNNIPRLATSSVGVSIPQDLDVDGHTNLDNVSVAGVSTFSNNVKFDGATAGRDITFIRSSNTLEFANNAILELGNGGSGDCRLFNNGTDTRIINGDGTLKFESDTHEFKDKDNTTSYLNITSAGHLGVGDDSPDTRLSVKAASGTDVVGKFTSTDANAWIQFRDNTTTDTGVMVGANGDNLLLRAGSNTRVTIDSSGHITPGAAGTQDLGSTSKEFRNLWCRTN